MLTTCIANVVVLMRMATSLTSEFDRNRFVYANIGYQHGFDDGRHAWEAKIGCARTGGDRRS